MSTHFFPTKAILLPMLCLGSAVLWGAETHMVTADFNDCTVDKSLQANQQPTNTGTGFLASGWEGGTASVGVISGDLTAPASSNYLITQSGNPRSILVKGVSSTTRRQQFRSLSTAHTGTIWLSLLIQSRASHSRVGITFNIRHTDPQNQSGKGRIYAEGSSLVIQPWTGSTITLDNQFALAQTTLLLVKFETENKRLTVWLNPVLGSDPEAISSTPAYEGTADILNGNTLSTIGLGGYSTNSANSEVGVMDSLRIASGDHAYMHVTGISQAPIVTEHPLDQSVMIGSNVSFSANAVSLEPLRYHWYHENTLVSASADNVLNLTNVSLAAAGNYHCVITNEAETVSNTTNSAMLYVYDSIEPVTITTHPEDQSPQIGESASFSVSASGTLPIYYQWHKDGTPITNATSPSYSIASASFDDEGSYTCVLSNSAGPVTSNPARLGIAIAPAIITQPQSANSYAGGSASFIVSAKGSNLTYQWFHNGQAIDNSNSPILSLSNLSAADAGTYHVTISNSLDSLTSGTATLSVDTSSPPPPASGSLIASGDTFIRDNTPRNGSGLILSGRDTSGVGKVYLSFELPAAIQASNVNNASLQLTLHSESPISNNSKNPMRIRLYGIVNNDDNWDETTLAWNNAPASAAESLAGPGQGARLLGSLLLDSATVTPSDTLVFSDSRIADFLNWAAGRLPDIYDVAHPVDSDKKITFILTVADSGTNYPSLRITDKERASATNNPAHAPTLFYETESTTLPTDTAEMIENESYRITVGPTHDFVITHISTNTSATFSANFIHHSQAASPQLGTSSNIEGAEQGASSNQVNFSVLAWSGNTAYTSAPGNRDPLIPFFHTIRKNQIFFHYESTSKGSFTASIDLPQDGSAPRLKWQFSPLQKQYHAINYMGASPLPLQDVDEFYLPGIWNGRRFQTKQYLIDEARATFPGAFHQTTEVLSGVIIDPEEIPNRVATVSRTGNSRFALGARPEADGLSQPMVHAPIYGSPESQTDAVLDFSVRLQVSSPGIDAAIRDGAISLYNFRDYRKNLPGGSLNTALDNICDYILNSSGVNYYYWDPNTKANNYINDKPGYARFQSASAAVSLAMVRDDSILYQERALPTIEYFISRNRDLLKIGGYDPEYGMGGPVTGYPAVDFYALYSLTRGRTSAFLALANEINKDRTLVSYIPETITRGQSFDLLFSYLRSLVQSYRITKNPEELSAIRRLADAYIQYRIDTPQADFRDVKSSFWNFMAPAYDAMLEVYDLTQDPSYADAAKKSLDQFIRHIDFAPAIHPTLRVNATHTDLPYVQVSEIGLTSEAAATSASHRGIQMPYATPSLLRVSLLKDDPFYAHVGKSGMVGRFLNYPGYAIRNQYNSALQQADYPLRDYTQYENTAHMNHPLLLAVFVMDYLMADTEYRSRNAIKFPFAFSDSRSYFRVRVYGAESGKFYTDENVWPWMPGGLVSFSGENSNQVNYISGHGNNKLYIAMANQSPEPLTVTLHIDSSRVTLTPGATMRVWQDNVRQEDSVFTNNQSTVTLSPNGFTAIAIDNATPQLDFQNDYLYSTAPSLPEGSYLSITHPTLERIVGVVLSVSPLRQSAYVYIPLPPDASGDTGKLPLRSATLQYQIDDLTPQVITKDIYPFEFSVPLPANAQRFKYTIQATPLDSGTSPITAGPYELIVAEGPVPPDIANEEQLLIHALTSNYTLTPSNRPTTHGSLSHLPQTRINENGMLCMTFTPLRDEYTYEVQVSDDMENWTTIHTTHSGNGSTSPVEVESPVAAPRQFLRLKIFSPKNTP